MNRFQAPVLVCTLGFLALPTTSRAGQPIETESTRILKGGAFEVELGAERQTSSEGTETALPLAVAYGISDRVELLVEPVPFSSIHDKGLPSQRGVGDMPVEANWSARSAPASSGAPGSAESEKLDGCEAS